MHRLVIECDIASPDKVKLNKGEFRLCLVPQWTFRSSKFCFALGVLSCIDRLIEHTTGKALLDHKPKWICGGMGLLARKGFWIQLM
jgi:hypothetical protein